MLIDTLKFSIFTRLIDRYNLISSQSSFYGKFVLPIR
jgi:hypothetical protein